MFTTVNILFFEDAHSLLNTRFPYPFVEYLDEYFTFSRQSGLGWVLEESRTRKYRNQSVSEGSPGRTVG